MTPAAFLVTCFASGAAAAGVYLLALWRSVRRLPGAQYPLARYFVGLTMRLTALLAASYWLLTFGPQAIVAASAGFIVTRFVILTLCRSTLQRSAPHHSAPHHSAPDRSAIGRSAPCHSTLSQPMATPSAPLREYT